MTEDEKPGSGSGSRSDSGTGTGTDTGTGTGRSGKVALFDHEKLEVYSVAREFLVLATSFPTKRLGRELRDQFERASMSILANIGEGAGKMSRADKQRFYEIARGSTTETATLLDIMQLRNVINGADYQRARDLLIRVAQMLSRLTAGPRSLR